MKKLFSRFIYNLSTSLLSFILSFSFVLYVAVSWFIGQRFFLGEGTTDLHRFFSAFPSGASVLIPLLVSISNSKNKFSFPYSSVKIILAQLFSVLSFCGAAIICTFTIPASVAFFGDVEISQCLSGYLGILLFFFSAISFCLAVFSFIQKSTVAFFISLIALLIVNKIHNLPLYADYSFAYIPVRLISFSWHFDSFAKGIISINEILYFLIVAFIFIFINWHFIEKKKGNKSRNFRETVFAFSITAVLLSIFALLVPVKFDVTKSKKFTMSEYTKKMISEISDPLQITYYLSPKLKELYPQVGDIIDFLESFSACSSHVSLKIINPSTQEIQNSLAQAGIYGQPIRSNSLNSSSINNVYSAVTFDYLGMKETIPFLISSSSLEFDAVQKIKSMTEEKQRLVQIVVANSLSLEKDYSYLVPYFRSLGFVPFESSLPSLSTEQYKSFDNFTKVPLVIIGSENFTREDCKALEKFILDGGKVFAAIQPFSVDIQNDWSIKQSEEQLYLARTFFTFGIYFKPTLTCDISNFRLTMQSNTDSNGKQTDERNEFINYPLWPVLLPQIFAPNGMTCFWPCAFDIDNDVSEIAGLYVTPMLTTSSMSWQIDKIDGSFITNPFVCKKKPDPDSVRNSFTIGACVTNRNDSEDIRMILMSDQYAFATPMISYSSVESSMDFRSLEFLGNSMLMLCGEKNLLEIKNKPVFNHSLYKLSGDDLYLALRKTVALTVILPVLLYLFSGILIMKIQKKRMSIK